MAKSRQVKKSAFLVPGLLLFFGVYIISFLLFSKIESADEKNAVKIQTLQEDNRPLLKKLEEKEKI